MRKILSLLAMMALAGCGGGGGANTAPQPVAPATTAPPGNLVTPTFTLNLGGKSGSSTGRNPKFIDGANTLSVKITLVSNNGTPTTVTNPSVTTNVNGTSGNPCTPTCTVPGPPSPPGTDRYTVTTFDATGGTGNTLSTATKDFTIVAGSANTGLTITLFGVVKSFSTVGGITVPNAGTTPANAPLTVTALDAAGGTITGTYGDNSTGAGYISGGGLNGTPVTVSINEINPLGATLVAGGGATQNTNTNVTLHSDADSVSLHYAGLAENVKTITVAATGASSQTASFQPALQPITPASGTEIDLYVDSTTGGTGSSGTSTFTEAGFTGATYLQTFSSTFTMTSGFSTPCDQIANVSQGGGANGGIFTVTAPAAAKPPAAGSCDLTINDNLTQGGHTSTAKTVVTYTTSSVGASSKHRKQ
jgi:hypothetical protein